MQSDAATVTEYLAGLPDDRRKAMAAVRKVIRANLPKGIVESMNWGMIVYEVPLTTYPDTYNGQPLAYAGLASQKNHMSVYLMGIYGSDTLRAEFEEAYRATGKRMDIGKSCVRFRTLDDLPLDVVGRCRRRDDAGAVPGLHDEAASLRESKKSRRQLTSAPPVRRPTRPRRTGRTGAPRVEHDAHVVLGLDAASVAPRATASSTAESRSPTWKSKCIIGRCSPSTGGHTGGR